jgi:hypothetical protein
MLHCPKEGYVNVVGLAYARAGDVNEGGCTSCLGSYSH